MSPLTTDRLILRLVAMSDAPFILALLNDPAFIRFVGDRGVRTVEQARAYLERGAGGDHPGLGLYVVTRRADGEALGICSLMQRESLPHPDLGFAMLEAHRGQGLGYEAASAMQRYARTELGFPRLLAITSPDNRASIALLETLGFHRDRSLTMPGETSPAVLFVDAAELPRARPTTP